MIFNNQPLDWDRDGPTWPHHQYSRFVSAARVRFHVQTMGQGPAVLFLHGTGASTHSWREVAPLLARDFKVIMVDLPGHGFTSMPGAGLISLHSYAALLGQLIVEIDADIKLAVGHSAGAAIACRMVLDKQISPVGIISFNGAFRPMGGGQAAQLFSPLARLLSLNPLVPRFFAGRAANPDMVDRLISGTGSRLSPDGVALYQRLMRSPPHVDAALQMMANWDLKSFADDMTGLACRLLLITSDADKAIPPEDARHVAERVANAETHEMHGLGHVAHEEDPTAAAGLIVDAWQRWQAA